jgi:gmma-aminobutyric acid receptor subunit gamma/cGMP-dependent protein kinase 2
MMQSLLHHTALSHLDKRNTYVKMLFIEYSSAPSKLIAKLRTLGPNISLCNWILDFLMGRPLVVRVGNNTYATLILNTGAPQWCILSTHDWMAKHESNTIIKFADDTTVVDLITNSDETSYREDVRELIDTIGHHILLDWRDCKPKLVYTDKFGPGLDLICRKDISLSL